MAFPFQQPHRCIYMLVLPTTVRYGDPHAFGSSVLYLQAERIELCSARVFNVEMPHLTSLQK
jgi:hypothetical protein